MTQPPQQTPGRALTPDPPQPPGTPDPPNLDVDVEQFLSERDDVPEHSDVNPDAPAPEPPS